MVNSCFCCNVLRNWWGWSNSSEGLALRKSYLSPYQTLIILYIKKSNLHIDFNCGHPESILGGWQSVAQNIPSSNHLVQHLDRWLGCEGWSKPKIRLHLITHQVCIWLHQVCIWSHQICIWSHQIGHVLNQSFITDLGCHHLPDPCIVAPLLNGFWQLSSVLPAGGKKLWNLLFWYCFKTWVGHCLASTWLQHSHQSRSNLPPDHYHLPKANQEYNVFGDLIMEYSIQYPSLSTYLRIVLQNGPLRSPP